MAHTDGNMVQVYLDGERVASHLQGVGDYRYSTLEVHMPPNHRFWKGLSPDKLLAIATSIGEAMTTLIRKVLDCKKHPEQGYRAALGLLDLAKRSSPARLIAAAARALHYGAYRRRGVLAIFGLANFKPEGACLENVKYRPERGILKGDLNAIRSPAWVEAHRNVLLIGPTDAGKTYIAEAITLESCKMGYSAQKVERVRRPHGSAGGVSPEELHFGHLTIPGGALAYAHPRPDRGRCHS